MNYQIIVKPKAEKQFLKLPSRIQQACTPKILSLEENPRMMGNQKLWGDNLYRLRIGDYRLIYSIDDKGKTVSVLDIAHRKDVYS